MSTKRSNQKEVHDLKSLGVIMPAFNEEATVAQAVAKVLAQTCVKEVIAVNDGSTDQTGAILHAYAQGEPRLQVINHDHNRGKGAAIKSALQLISAPVVIIQDADLEYDPGDYSGLIEPILIDGAPVVYGSRFMKNSCTTTHWMHVLQNKCLTKFANLLTGFRLTDEATCYKVFKREVICSFTFEEDGFGFCPEVTGKLRLARHNIIELPIRYQARNRAAGKKLRLRDGLHAIACLMKYTRAAYLQNRNAAVLQESECYAAGRKGNL